MFLGFVFPLYPLSPTPKPCHSFNKFGFFFMGVKKNQIFFLVKVLGFRRYLVGLADLKFVLDLKSTKCGWLIYILFFSSVTQTQAFQFCLFYLLIENPPIKLGDLFLFS